MTRREINPSSAMQPDNCRPKRRDACSVYLANSSSSRDVEPSKLIFQEWAEITALNSFSLLSERRIFQEWARNRYGIFPEFGFPGDRLYPEFYTGDDGSLVRNEDCDNVTALYEKAADDAQRTGGDGVQLQKVSVCLSVGRSIDRVYND